MIFLRMMCKCLFLSIYIDGVETDVPASCPYCKYPFANIKIKFCTAKSMNVNIVS